MSLKKPQSAVDAAAVEAAEVESKVTADVLEPETAPEKATVEQAAEPAPSTSTEVAEVQTHAVRAASQQQAAMASLAEQGFEGLQIDYTSFPQITLKDGEFNLSTGGVIPATANAGFKGRITATKMKYAFRIKTKSDDEDADVQFTDNLADAKDPLTKVGAKVKEWEDEDLPWEYKEYVDCYVMVEEVLGDTGKELEGQLVVCQIPQTSRGRLTGMLATAAMKYQQQPGDFLTHFTRGNKVTNVQFPFYPWDFKRVAE